MPLDYETLDLMRRNHPAWKLLNAQYAPLIVSFLYRVYIQDNVRSVAESVLIEDLEDVLFALRDKSGADSYRGTAQNYLNDWADNEKGWLRKFYIEGTDEPHYDITPSTEKAISWLDNLSERTFVGTESRLLSIFDLLRQMSEGSETDPVVRIAELKKRRDAIDMEIEQIQCGNITLLDDTSLRDRFQQFLQLARDVMTDFREVEQNFRSLDRRVRGQIALWEGSKGALLEEIMGERDAISSSDQGKSFRAFWDFLMSQSRQEELGKLLDHVLSLKPVAEMSSGKRLNRIHYDWLEAGEHTQRMVARLSEQLRHFLDDKAWLENRRIMDILRNVEGRALSVRDQQPSGFFMEVDDITVLVEMSLERPLYKPPNKSILSDIALEAGETDIDTAALYQQIVVDRARLVRNIHQELQSVSQINLSEVIRRYPLEHGLAEIIGYMQIATSSWISQLNSVIDDKVCEATTWHTEKGNLKQALLPRIIFLRSNERT